MQTSTFRHSALQKQIPVTFHGCSAHLKISAVFILSGFNSTRLQHRKIIKLKWSEISKKTLLNKKHLVLIILLILPLLLHHEEYVCQTGVSFPASEMSSPPTRIFTFVKVQNREIKLYTVLYLVLSVSSLNIPCRQTVMSFLLFLKYNRRNNLFWYNSQILGFTRMFQICSTKTNGHRKPNTIDQHWLDLHFLHLFPVLHFTSPLSFSPVCSWF